MRELRARFDYFLETFSQGDEFKINESLLMHAIKSNFEDFGTMSIYLFYGLPPTHNCNCSFVGLFINIIINFACCICPRVASQRKLNNNIFDK